MSGSIVALCQTLKFSENYQIQEINRQSWSEQYTVELTKWILSQTWAKPSSI